VGLYSLNITLGGKRLRKKKRSLNKSINRQKKEGKATCADTRTQYEKETSYGFEIGGIGGWNRGSKWRGGYVAGGKKRDHLRAHFAEIAEHGSAIKHACIGGEEGEIGETP